MAYFLAGVGTAELFVGDQLFSTAKTLIDTSITIGVTAEDLRAGAGAQLYGKYFHSSTFDMTFTDLMFRMEYIAANVGSDITMGGDAIHNEQVTLATGGVGTVLGTPFAFGNYGLIGWVAKPNSENWTKINFTGKTFTIAGGAEGDIYCVKYPQYDNASRKLIMSANIIPKTLNVYLTASLFSGDANNPSTGTKAGIVTIKVPRFLLNGTQDIAMSMTGAANTTLTGSALSAGASGCEGEGYYAEMIETIFGTSWYDNVIGLVVSDADFELNSGATKTLDIYATYNSAVPKRVDNANLTFVSADPAVATIDSEGIVTGVAVGESALRIKITERPEIEGVAFVTVI